MKMRTIELPEATFDLIFALAAACMMHYARDEGDLKHMYHWLAVKDTYVKHANKGSTEERDKLNKIFNEFFEQELNRLENKEKTNV